MDYPVTEFDRIWNRAALENGGVDPLKGDQNLAAMLYMHGMIANGGVFHALDELTSEEITKAVIGYQFFGFEEVANLLKSLIGTIENDEAEIESNSKYFELLPDDTFIFDRVESLFKVSPYLFASIED